MSLAKLLVLAAALASATPALAGDGMTGWGGRYGVHRQAAESSSYESSGYRQEVSFGEAGYQASTGGYARSEETSGSWNYRRMETRPMCRRLADQGAYDRRRLPLCPGEGEVSLPGDFFLGDAGVGGFPESSYGGGGGGYAFISGGGGARAFASASAHASVSVRFHGGFRGGHHGGGGHKGGCGCK